MSQNKIKRIKKGFTTQELVKSIEQNEKTIFYPELTMRLDKKTNKADESGARPVYTFVMSEEIRDRAGHVVIMSGGDVTRYNKNPIISFMHETERDWYDTQPYNPDYVIGKGYAYLKDGKYYNDIVFETLEGELNEVAEKIRRKIDFGSLSACSIGFIPLKGHWGNPDDGEDSGTYYITEWELLELAIVVIPCLYSALLEGSDPADDQVVPAQDPMMDPQDEAEQKNHNSGVVSADTMAMNINIFNSQNKHLLCQN